MVFIPYAVKNTITVRGKAWKDVCCEKCRTEYAYIVTCEGSGSGTNFLLLNERGSKQRAEAEAVRNLDHALEQAMTDVPCPACGWYQREMIPAARRRHNRWMLERSSRIGASLVLLLPVSALLYAVASSTPAWLMVLYAITGCLSVTAVGLCVAKFVTSVRYDPNAEDEEQRKQRGREYGILRADLEKRLREEARENPAGEAPPEGAEGQIRKGLP